MGPAKRSDCGRNGLPPDRAVHWTALPLLAYRLDRGRGPVGRAARIIDRTEEEGIIGPDRGAGKPREVLMDSYGAGEEI